MNKIKSERAIEYIENNNYVARDFPPLESVMSSDDVIESIKLAEQDAEERAVKAFEEAMRQIAPLCYMPIDREQWRRSFKNLLNGGQSDE